MLQGLATAFEVELARLAQVVPVGFEARALGEQAVEPGGLFGAEVFVGFFEAGDFFGLAEFYCSLFWLNFIVIVVI